MDASHDQLTSNVEAGYVRLREAILRDELAAGSRISQVQLAAEMQMSRGPLREALRMLEREGLVEAEHNRMVTVAESSFDDMVDLYATRIVNDSFATAVSCLKATDEDLAALRQQLVEMDDAAEAADWEAWSRYHRAFHLRLAAGAGRRVRRIVTEGFDHSERYRRIYRAEESAAAPTVAAREHSEIVNAFGDRDSVAAATLLARHLARTVLTVLAHAAPEYEPLLIRDAVRFVDRRKSPLQGLTK
jgi:DNA-binding GntR family transcriptional regulator